jgi:hypothetical protein
MEIVVVVMTINTMVTIVDVAVTVVAKVNTQMKSVAVEKT